MGYIQLIPKRVFLKQLVTHEIATKLKVSEAKLLLRWGLQHGYCVLTRSSKPERIRENLNVFDFEIPDNDMERLNRLNQNQAFAWAANGLTPMEVVPLPQIDIKTQTLKKKKSVM